MKYFYVLVVSLMYLSCTEQRTKDENFVITIIGLQTQKDKVDKLEFVVMDSIKVNKIGFIVCMKLLIDC